MINMECGKVEQRIKGSYSVVLSPRFVKKVLNWFCLLLVMGYVPSRYSFSECSIYFLFAGTHAQLSQIKGIDVIK